MTRQNVEMVFSLLFFFFSSFFFMVIISSNLFNNFDNLIFIILKPGGFFLFLSEILLFAGVMLSIYFYIAWVRGKRLNQLKRFVLGGGFVFIVLLLFSILNNVGQNDVEKMLNNYKDDLGLVESIKKLIIDSIVFICFIVVPLLNYFYKKHILHNYFYRSYLQNILPSLNTSIFFLFGYVIGSYDFRNISSIIDFSLCLFCVILFAKIAFNLRHDISFWTVVNFLVLMSGFIVFIVTSKILENGNLYYASVFFYILAFLYWFVNITIRLKNAV